MTRRRGEGHGLWRWIDANDDARCASALGDLLRAGVLVGDDLGWLSPAMQQGTGGPPGVAIPWAAWAVRVGDGVGVPVAAGPLAVAVTVLNAREFTLVFDERSLDDEHVAPDHLTRAALAARLLGHVAGGRGDGQGLLADRIAPWLLGLGDHPAASTPRNPPIHALAGKLGPAEQPAHPHASCCVREAVTLWTLPVLFAGEDVEPWMHFGQAVAEPITLLGDLVRLWHDPAAHDLRAAALTPLVEVLRSDPVLGGSLLRAYAGERTSAARRDEIRSLLASEPFRARLASVARRVLTSARDRLPRHAGAGLLAVAEEFVDALVESFRAVDQLMTVRAFLDIGHASSTCPGTAAHRPLREDAEADLGMAAAFLSEHAPWRASWEVQRFGIDGFDGQPVGHWFVRGTILRTLLELGHDVRGEAARLLSEIPPGELRYYEAWPHIPPDADLLGLMLELAAATGAAWDRPETWIAFLLANTDGNGVAPTWFSRDPAGHPTTASDPAWGGDQCNAVRLNLLSGLLAFDAARFDRVIQANTSRVLECSGAGAVDGIYYYDAAFAALAFLRFARQYHRNAIDRSFCGPVATAAAAVRTRLVGSQRLDGGWGSPQRTAFCLAGCTIEVEAQAGSSRKERTLLLDRAMRYLGEHQLVDGSWPAEPFYRIPMKRGREGHHQGRELTTAACAGALHAGLAVRAERELPDSSFKTSKTSDRDHAGLGTGSASDSATSMRM